LRAQRTHLLEISAGVQTDELRVDFTYGSRVHRRATIERLADRFAAALDALVEGSRAGTELGFTQSDLADVGWSAEDVEDLLFDDEDMD
jgi:non-ribosomal peptide synthase protein (TIGR01720 family)